MPTDTLDPLIQGTGGRPALVDMPVAGLTPAPKVWKTRASQGAGSIERRLLSWALCSSAGERSPKIPEVSAARRFEVQANVRHSSFGDLPAPYFRPAARHLFKARALRRPLCLFGCRAIFSANLWFGVRTTSDRLFAECLRTHPPLLSAAKSGDQEASPPNTPRGRRAQSRPTTEVSRPTVLYPAHRCAARKQG